MSVISALALLQSVLGLLRALHWFDVGSDLMGQGWLLLPLIGVLAFLRGAFLIAIVLSYVVFAYGALLGRNWARWLGIVVAGVSLLLVLSIVIQGETVARALLWSIVPLVMLVYLLTPAARPALLSEKS